jgi:hypothetical protein
MRVGARQRLKARSFSASPGLHPADVGNWKISGPDTDPIYSQAQLIAIEAADR